MWAHRIACSVFLGAVASPAAFGLLPVTESAPRPQPAILVHKTPEDSLVRIERIDGKAVRACDGVYVLEAGTHSVEVVPTPSNARRERVIRWFDTVPGGRYELDARTVGDHWGFWVQDLATRKRIDRATRIP